nr:NADH-plastoquinone oxidoreductase subunit 4L [Paphiopedilum hirsutissimum]
MHKNKKKIRKNQRYTERYAEYPFYMKTDSFFFLFTCTWVFSFRKFFI